VESEFRCLLVISKQYHRSSESQIKNRNFPQIANKVLSWIEKRPSAPSQGPIKKERNKKISPPFLSSHVGQGHWFYCSWELLLDTSSAISFVIIFNSCSIQPKLVFTMKFQSWLWNRMVSISLLIMAMCWSISTFLRLNFSFLLAPYLCFWFSSYFCHYSAFSKFSTVFLTPSSLISIACWPFRYSLMSSFISSVLLDSFCI